MPEHFSEDMIYKALSARGEGQYRLFASAREKRREYFPACEVEVRSVIETSNVCAQKCAYCGMSRSSRRKRYAIPREELLSIVQSIYSKGRRVLLLQSGENGSRAYIDFISESVSHIKKKFRDMTVMLCMGSLSYRQYRQLRGAGADRYILKFETSNPELYKQIKPGDSLQARMECLNNLIQLGFDVGSGNIVGLPGQSMQDIAHDLFFISRFKLSMASCSVFIPGEDSEYHSEPAADADVALNYMALMRIMYPEMLIPSTSSLEKAKKGGQLSGLAAGANAVTVHDGTPEELKKHFPIYSANRFTPNEEHIRDIVSQAGLKFTQSAISGRARMEKIIA